MARRPLASAFIILLGLLVLSRHITGAPGAQVEVFRNLINNKAVEAKIQEAPPLLIDPSIQDCSSDSFLFGQKTRVENKSSYKKYVSPEKTLDYKQIPQIAQSNYQSTAFSQFWLFATLPQVIHANDPPRITSPQTHSIHPPLTVGDRDYLYETKSCTDNRGVCVICVRP